MEVAEINAPLYVTRRYNLVTMKGATITEIIAGIEKSYGVRIRIMSPDDGKRYDINYLRSNSLEEVVDIVEFMTGTHCEVIRQRMIRGLRPTTAGLCTAQPGTRFTNLKI